MPDSTVQTAVEPTVEPIASGVPWLPDALGWLLAQGGPVMAILAVMSVLALTIILLKSAQLVRLGSGLRGSLDIALRHWRDGQRTAALAHLAASRNPLLEPVRVAMRGHDKGHDLALLREEAERHAQALVAVLHSHLRSLEVIANLSPLLGLLGTVLGMIGAFQALASAGSQVDPAVLSGGIWVALLTTAAGLSVAIPTVMALNALERIAERRTRQLEDALTQVFTSSLYLQAADQQARSANAPLESLHIVSEQRRHPARTTTDAI